VDKQQTPCFCKSVEDGQQSDLTQHLKWRTVMKTAHIFVISREIYVPITPAVQTGAQFEQGNGAHKQAVISIFICAADRSWN
jgi:hypothetical protein